MTINNCIEENAWMISKYGEIVPCTQHIYANPDELYETLYAAEWLYKNTRQTASKKLVLKLIKSYGASLNYPDYFNAILKDIHKKQYRFLTVEFIKSISDELQKAETEDTGKLCKLTETALNDEFFLRARYGGLYNTSEGVCDIYFRLSCSKEKFELYNSQIIYNFVLRLNRPVSSITVVKDEESAGIKNGFYVAADGRKYDKIPISDYYKNPEIRFESKLV